MATESVTPLLCKIPPRRQVGLFRREEPISHERASRAAERLIHSHFGLNDHARMSIPVDVDDDDVVIMDYIRQQILKDIGEPDGNSR